MAYLVIAAEDSFGTEKNPEFVTPSTLLTTKETPPAGLILAADYVDLMFTDGDFGDRSSDSETVKTSCGDVPTTNYTPSREPNMTVEMDFKRLGYLLGRFQDFYALNGVTPVKTNTPSAADTAWLVAGNQNHDTKSDTIYLKQYSDAEYVNTGFQISELSYDISDKGMIEYTLNGVSSYERLGVNRDKAYGVCAADILKTDSIVNVYIKELTDVFTPSIDDDLTLVGYEEIGCSLNSLNLALTNSMSEDSFSPCGLFNAGKPVLRSGKRAVESKENTFSSESKQTDSKWLRLFFGGRGSVDYIKSKKFAIVIVYQNATGQLRQIMPNCSIVPATPNMAVEDPTEELTIVPSFGDLKYTATGGAAASVNTDVATYYNTVGTNMASIAYAKVVATGLAGRKLTIRTPAAAGSALQQYYVFKDNDSDLIIPLYTGTYSLYELDAAGEHKKGSDFVLDNTNNSEATALNLTTQFSAAIPPNAPADDE